MVVVVVVIAVVVVIVVVVVVVVVEVVVVCCVARASWMQGHSTQRTVWITGPSAAVSWDGE